MSLAQKLREFLPTVYERYGPLNARQYAYRAETERIIDASRGKKKPFNYVNKILVELREKKVLPWSAVLDSSREFQPFQMSSGYRSAFWLRILSSTNVKGSEDVDDFVKGQMEFFRKSDELFNLPAWHYQPIVPVIFTEKEGLIPFFQMITDDKAVSVYAQKGQVGKSHLHEVVFPWLMRLCADGKTVRIIYLGDCDDEGFQIPVTLLSTITDWADGSPQFDIYDLYPRYRSKIYQKGSAIIFERLALMPEQVENYGLSKLPINPKSKIAKKFIDFKCELEALDPDELRRLISEAIDKTWDSSVEQRRNEKVEELRKKIKPEIDRLTKGWED